jgi:prophage antirepressor-like protein
MSNVITLPTVYKFHANQVRVTLIDGEPWFALADICTINGIKNPSQAAAKLDVDEKRLHSIKTPGGTQSLMLVSESGMYIVTLRCHGAMTQGTTPYRFRKWVTSEVLPSIRKTGAYAVDVAPEVPLLINHQQQMALERAVHDLALYAGSKGRNYRSVCLTTWRDLRQQFDLKEYCQLPAERFQEAIDFVLDKRAEWEVDCDARGYTLENFMDMMHDFYIEGRVPTRVEVELARQCLMRARDAIVETKLQIGGLNISDPEARKCINNARRILSRRNLNVPIDPVYQSLQLRRVA